VQGRPKKTWHEVVETDLKSFPFDKFDALERKNWKKIIRCREVSGDGSDDSG